MASWHITGTRSTALVPHGGADALFAGHVSSLLNKGDRHFTITIFRGIYVCQFGASPLLQQAVRTSCAH